MKAADIEEAQAKLRRAAALDAKRRDAQGNWVGENDKDVGEALTLHTEVSMFLLGNAEELLRLARDGCK